MHHCSECGSCLPCVCAEEMCSECDGRYNDCFCVCKERCRSIHEQLKIIRKVCPDWMPQASAVRKAGNPIDKALLIAHRAHHGQVDKGGKPYILHPLYVESRMTTEQGRVVALLHDVIEDSTGETAYTLATLAQEGFDSEVVTAVECLTRREYEAYASYLVRIAGNPLACEVKLIDLEHNSNKDRLTDLTEKDRKRLDKYTHAKAFLERRGYLTKKLKDVVDKSSYLGQYPSPHTKELYRLDIETGFVYIRLDEYNLQGISDVILYQEHSLGSLPSISWSFATVSEFSERFLLPQFEFVISPFENYKHMRKPAELKGINKAFSIVIERSRYGNRVYKSTVQCFIKGDDIWLRYRGSYLRKKPSPESSLIKEAEVMLQESGNISDFVRATSSLTSPNNENTGYVWVEFGVWITLRNVVPIIRFRKLLTVKPFLMIKLNLVTGNDALDSDFRWEDFFTHLYQMTRDYLNFPDNEL